MTDTLWSQPHHDGSALYVPEPNPQLGGKTTVFLRVPRASDVTRAWVRVLADGEPELVAATVDRQDQRDTWLRVRMWSRLVPWVVPQSAWPCQARAA